MSQLAQNQFKEIRIEAVKITADGKRVELGTVSYWHKNPIKRFAFWLRNKLWQQ